MSKLRLQSKTVLRAPRVGRLEVLRPLLPLPPVSVLAAAAEVAARGCRARKVSKPENGVELGVAG